MLNDESMGDRISSTLLGAVISILPFITYLKVVNLQGDTHRYWNGARESFDFFTYYKVVALLILTGIIFIYFLYKIFKKDIQLEKTKIYIPLGIYGVLVIISTILSDHKQVALWGFVERWEGMIVILAYLLLFFITINILKAEKDYKRIITFFIISAVVMGLIGIFQYLGYDLIKTDFIKKIILPSQYESLSDKIKFNFDKGTIYTTLYHYNYVGSYMAMLFPMILALALLWRNKIIKILLGLVSLLMFSNLIASNSRAGIVGGILAILVLIVILRKRMLKHWKIVLSGLGIAMVILMILNQSTNGMLINRTSSLFKDAKNLLSGSTQNKDIKDVVVKDNKLSLVYPNDTLNVLLNNNALEFKDSNGKTMQVELTNKGLIIKDNRYKDYVIQINQIYTYDGTSKTLVVNNGALKLNFILKDNTFKFVNPNGEEVELHSVPYFGFEGKEKLGSARGYIWSRSIPLLKDTVIKGNGPDTFAIYFPQDDYIGKYKAYGILNMFVDKPHDLYLQTALNTGVISLLAMLVLFGMYIVNSLKLYFNNDLSDFYSILGLAIFVSFIGYLGAGIFNDSAVSVAPIFWVIFGMGVSVNLKLIKEKAESK